MYYFFRLDFWNYSRWSNSFWLPVLPPENVVQAMAEIWAVRVYEQLPDMRGKAFTGFELCKDKEANKKLKPGEQHICFSAPGSADESRGVRQLSFFDITTA